MEVPVEPTACCEPTPEAPRAASLTCGRAVTTVNFTLLGVTSQIFQAQSNMTVKIGVGTRRLHAL